MRPETFEFPAQQQLQQYDGRDVCRPSCRCWERGLRSHRQQRRCVLHFAIAAFLTALLSLCLLQHQVISHSLSPGQTSSSCGDVFCLHGTCVDGRCVCDRGWQGSACHRCSGRLLLNSPSGFISDGSTNYSTDLQCTWLIDSGSKSSVIRLQLTDFETECGWDHLYIFDGDSVFSPLVAAYSGLLLRNGQQFHEVPEVVTHSGKAYLYFYSDAAYNMSGFNVSYSVNGCPRNCSSRGACSAGSCVCDTGWDGDACELEVCPNSCSLRGVCDTGRRMCICTDGWAGSDCSQRRAAGVWELLQSVSTTGRALHAAVVEGNSMWVAGGEFFSHPASREETAFMIRYDFFRKAWDRMPDSYRPDHRFSHTMTLYERKLYLYGGTLVNGSVSNELWMYDLDQRSWSPILPSDDQLNQCVGTDFCAPIAASGHSATLVDDKIIFLFGHNVIFGYMNVVQEFNLTTRRWTLAQTHGLQVKGGYGHSAAYDPDSRTIYVYGGYHSHGTDSVLVDLLYAYDTSRNRWKKLTSSSSPRYLHSALILNGAMIVFGGNGHNATHDKAGDKCFSPQVLMYDPECDSWHIMHDPVTALKRNLETGRFGHSAVLHDNSVYFFAGFNGLMLNSILKFTPGDCADFSHSASECSGTRPGLICLWNHEKNLCISRTSLSSSIGKNAHISSNSLSAYTENRMDRCARGQSNSTDLCPRLSSCISCLDSLFGCVWCPDSASCHYEKCRKPAVKGLTDASRCESEVVVTTNCQKLHNCQSCHTEPHCGWHRDNKCYPVKDMSNRTLKAMMSADMRPVCETPCHQRTSCINCSAGPSCMWCSSLQRCIESNAYAATFPMAQCMEWTIHKTKCTNCSDIQTCNACQLNPRCGWCDDGSGTGVGRCMEGAGDGPYSWTDRGSVMMPEMCKSRRWFFTSCPLCQCNGHSACLPGQTECLKPCRNLTEGSHCQHCQEKYFGDPVNGGSCKPCFCHTHSEKCNRTTGKCHCTTKGITGDACDRCDEQNHYYGNPTERGGSCYYNLTIDFQYTFNMSKADDKYLTKINFMNVPMKSDVDVDFTISCSRSSLVNISIGSNSLPVRVLYDVVDCGSQKIRFSHDDHLFGIENTTFYVNVFRFETPFVLQISFSQHRTLDLLQFFVTFSSCFLTLLIIAAILWKIKQKYDMYRRRQQLFLELAHMASRPFAGIVLQLEKTVPATAAPRSEGQQFVSPNFSHSPTPVALEPCSSGKSAVLSLVVRLPTGGTGVVPPGQTGLAIASALVSLGTLDHRFRETTTTADSGGKTFAITSKNMVTSLPATAAVIATTDTSQQPLSQPPSQPTLL